MGSATSDQSSIGDLTLPSKSGSQDLVFELGKPFLLPIADPCGHESKQSLNRGCLLNQW